MSRKGKRWILAKHFEGFPKESDLRLEEYDLPELKEGEILVEAEYLSVDPYMRPYSRRLTPGDTMIGQQVAKVVESRNDKFHVGVYVLPQAGWTTRSVQNCDQLMRMPMLPEGLPRLHALGTVGMPGVTAYVGLLDLCEPKEGETVLVSGAAGAVGHVVGQIAKIKGCRVIGSAGSDEKVAWLKELGFDEVFNYKTVTDLDAKLKELAPDGIDVYFDNVGGHYATTVIQNMKKFGRIANCGAISGYNDNAEKINPPYKDIVGKELKLQGFIVSSHLSRWPAALMDLSKWVAEGKIKTKERVTTGFDNMFTAFTELFTGANIGKAVVKV